LKKRAGTLETLWKNIPSKVKPGETRAFHYNFEGMNQHTVEGLTEIYSCTAIVIVTGTGAFLGHFKEECGTTTTIDSQATIKKEILNMLGNGEIDKLDIPTNAQVYIIHSHKESSGVTSTTCYNQIKT
jgi:hypothetical protein